MKKLRLAIEAFHRILNADEWCIYTVRGDELQASTEMKAENYIIFVEETLGNQIGQQTTLEKFKALLKNEEQSKG